MEDFCDVSGAEVVVSTIHKAKGREFDDVYLLIADKEPEIARPTRRHYVGITRARNRLFVHTNLHCFQNKFADRYVIDEREYSMPEEVVLQLSHRDVYLDFFKERKRDILALRSGDVLEYRDAVLYETSTHKAVAKLSSDMRQRMKQWEAKGYTVTAASVRFVVAWKPKDAPKTESETAVLLVDLVLSL